jgi:hypothetical protein
MKPYKEEKLIVCHFLEQIKDFNYVTNHFLTVFVNEQYRSKGNLPSLGVPDRSNGMSGTATPYSGPPGNPMGGYPGGNQPPRGGAPPPVMNEQQMGTYQQNMGSLTMDDNSLVMKLQGILATKPSKVFSGYDAKRAVGGVLNEFQLKEALQRLVHAGIIFNEAQDLYAFV